MVVKRRVIWMTDDEWFLIRQMAVDRDETVSQLIRSMWATAAKAEPLATEDATTYKAVLAQARETERYDVRPIRPVPKHGK